GDVAADAVAQETRRGSFTFTRNGTLTQLAQSLTVNFRIGGNATLEDYTTNDLGVGSITFAPNERVKTISYLPIDDGLVEGDENITISLVADPNYRFSGGASSTIVDDDDPPTVSIVAINAATGQEVSAPEVREGEINTIIYRITRSDIGAEDLVVPFRVEPTSSAQRGDGNDFNFVPRGLGLESPTDSFVTISAGETQAEFTLSPSENNDFSDDGEFFILSLVASGNYNLADQDSITTIIRDRSDTGNLNLSFGTLADEQGAEQGEDPIVFTLTRTGDNLTAIAVPFTLGGTATYSDYGDATNDDYSLQVFVNGTEVDADTFFNFTDGTTGILNIPAATPIDPTFDGLGNLIPQV
ncbi:MAG: hypothetical protein ACO3NK_20040, partial [Prochlorotrichaceae cyanobacterium]